MRCTVSKTSNKELYVAHITRNGNTGYWKNAKVFVLNLVVRRPRLTTSLKGDTLKEIIKEDVDGAELSSFYTLIKPRIP